MTLQDVKKKLTQSDRVNNRFNVLYACQFRLLLLLICPGLQTAMNFAGSVRMETIAEIVAGFEYYVEKLKNLASNHQTGANQIWENLLDKNYLMSGMRPNSKGMLYHFLFELNCNPVILSTFVEGRIVEANRAFYNVTGYRKKEVVGNTTIQLGLWPDMQARNDFLQMFGHRKMVTCRESVILTRSGQMHCYVSAVMFELDNCVYMLTCFVDSADEKRRSGSDKAPNITALEKNKPIEEIENMLKDFLERYAEKPKMFGDQIGNSLKYNVLPFIDMLKKENLDRNAVTYLNIIETRLFKILSELSCSQKFRSYGLTAAEVQVAEFIRQGKSSKEIAALIGVSVPAVSFHRNNIRKKIGLRNKKISLFKFFAHNEDHL